MEQDATKDAAARLAALEAERALLERELGYCDAESLVALVRNLEVQLRDLYAEKEEAQ